MFATGRKTTIRQCARRLCEARLKGSPIEQSVLHNMLAQCVQEESFTLMSHLVASQGLVGERDLSVYTRATMQSEDSCDHPCERRGMLLLVLSHRAHTTWRLLSALHGRPVWALVSLESGADCIG